MWQSHKLTKLKPLFPLTSCLPSTHTLFKKKNQFFFRFFFELFFLQKKSCEYSAKSCAKRCSIVRYTYKPKISAIGLNLAKLWAVEVENEVFREYLENHATESDKICRASGQSGRDPTYQKSSKSDMIWQSNRTSKFEDFSTFRSLAGASVNRFSKSRPFWKWDT